MPARWCSTPPPIDGDKRLAPAWSFYESEHKTYGSDLIWQFHEDWDIKLSHRYSSSYRYGTFPWLLANASGDYSAEIWNGNLLRKSRQTQAIIGGELITGVITHKLSVGMSHTRTATSNSVGSPSFSFHSFANLVNLSNPVEFSNAGILPVPKGDAEFNEHEHITHRELFLSDTLNIGEHWDLIIGLRHGSLDSKYADYKESEVTPTLAVIHRPVDWMSLYTSYAEAYSTPANAQWITEVSGT
ncbi:MAG: TonB-dependent receptor [Pseudomonadales bacterium]|nr:TonB-dependent receptor [Pseudomonadales bacterium]